MNALGQGKFAVPRRRRSQVSRRRLLNRLHESVGTGIMVLRAPSGYGKTTLLAEFASEVDFNVRWLSLDSSCSSANVFAQHLSIAISRQSGDGGPATSDRIDDLRAYLGRSVEHALASDLPLLLIIDNVHALSDGDDSNAILGWLLDSLPESAEVVLSGREIPPVPILERLMATGDCLVLDTEALAFTREEVAELLGADRAAEAERVVEASGGWPAAVMAMLAGTLRTGERKPPTASAWTQYLVTEVWEAVPAALRESFMRLALPASVDRELGIQLAGAEAWTAVIAWLDTHEFLVETLGGGQIRFNPIFRQFLIARFEQQEPRAFAEETGQMAARLAAAGHLAEAIEMARIGHRDDRLAALVEEHARELLTGGHFALLARAFDGLSEGAILARPTLRAFRARLYAHQARLSMALAEAELLRVDDALPPQARIDALLAKHRCFRLMGRSEEINELMGQLEQFSAWAPPALRAEAAYHRAQWLMGPGSDFDRAEELLRACLDASAEAQSPTLELLARSTLGQLLAMRGQAPAAVEELTRAARGWRARGGTSNLGWVLNNLGMAHIDVGDFESALPTLKEAVAQALTCENQRNYAYATASLADAELALGHADDARKSYEEAIRVCSEEAPDETLASLSISGLAAAFLALGDTQQADYFSKRALYIAETVGSELERGRCLLTHSAVLSSVNKHQEAAAAAELAAKLFTEIGALAPLAIAHYRLALCQFRANKKPEALATLALLTPEIREAWTVGVLIPAIREHPMFAQWAASRADLGEAFSQVMRQHSFARQTAEPTPAVKRPAFPHVEVHSLGATRVVMDGEDVDDGIWASAKSKELFFLFLANRDGLRKEEAVDQLYPEIEREKCNSAFHSNLYRVRKALYPESVIRRDGAYMLNPAASFAWDVDSFQELIATANALPAGSDERAELHKQALAIYRGPFAEVFYSEWAETLRRRTDDRAMDAIATLAGYHAGRRDFEQAARCMEDLVARDVGNEEAAYHVALYRARAGQSAIALSYINEYGRRLTREFGTPVPQRLTALRRSIAAGVAV